MGNIKHKAYTDELLEAFLECKSIAEIQKRTGLSRQTINKYREDRNFQDELARRKIEAVKAAVNKMQMSLSDIAAEVLSIATDKAVSPQIRLNACQVALSQCRSWTETTDILERLAAVEQVIKAEKITDRGM